MRTDDVRRVSLGTFVRPREETGTESGRVEAVYGYLIRLEDAVVLLDTGLGRGGRRERTIVFAPLAAFFSELFGTGVRYCGVSVGFQLGTLAPALLARSDGDPGLTRRS